MILKLPATLADRYEVSRFLGAGTFAETYYAQDRETGQDVAVKVLRPQFVSHRETLTRFEREARMTSEIVHPNVVRTLDYRMDGDSPFMVMEYVSGPVLKALLQERVRFSPEDAVTTTVQILAGLDAIHQNGMVHRDVKPHNVLTDPEHGARLSDFGIARALDQTGLTKTGTALGTANYMAPEQAQGRQVTPATDVYAVGVMLFEMLTGQVPFSGNDPLEVLYQQVHQKPPSPRELFPDVPEWLDRVTLRAMSKDPRDRFESANAMISGLNSANGSEDDTRVMDPAVLAAQAATAAMPARPAARTPRPRRPQRAASAAAVPPPTRPKAPARRSTWWRTPAFILLALLLLAGVVGALYALGTGDPPEEEPATVIDEPADDEPAVEDAETEVTAEPESPVEDEAPVEEEPPPEEAPAEEAPAPPPEEPEPVPEEEPTPTPQEAEQEDEQQDEETGQGNNDNPGQGNPPDHAGGQQGAEQGQGQGNQGQSSN